MAARTTSQNGNWSSSSTWGGSSPPGNGDTAIVQHAVTVDADTTVGRSGCGDVGVAPTAVNVTGGGAGGGALEAGTYSVGLLPSSGGADMGIILSTSYTTGHVVASGNIPRVSLPSLPAYADAFKVVLNDGSGWIYYKTGVTGSTTDLTTSVSGKTAVPSSGFNNQHGVWDLEVRTGSVLTVAAGVTLKVRGVAFQIDFASETGGVVLAAGAALELDGSQQSGERYFFGMWRGSRIETNGTAGSRCAVRSNASGTRGYFCAYGGSFATPGVRLDCEYTDFTDLGSSSVNAVTGADARNTLSQCVFRRCGRVYFGTPLMTSTNPFEMSEVTFRDSLGTANVFGAAPNGGGSGTSYVRGCVFDEFAFLPWDTTLVVGQSGRENIFLRGLGRGGSYSGPGPLAHSLVRWVDSTNVGRCGDWSDGAMVIDGSTLDLTDGTYSATADVTNPHWTTPLGGARVYAVTDWVFESFGDDGAGDVDYGPNNTGHDSAFTRVLGFSQNSDDPGTMSTFLGWSGQTDTSYDHCTWQTSQFGAVVFGEGSAGYAGMCAGIRSNIFYRKTNSAGVYKVSRYASEAVTTDVVAAADADYNCGFNLNTTGGIAGNGYNLTLTGTPGVHDVNADPGFVDWGRNFSTWVASLDPTWAGNGAPSRTDYNARGLWKLSLKNLPADADYDARYTLAAYLTYVRGGFAPTNAALRDAGHDSVTIGAVEGVFGGAPGPLVGGGLVGGGLVNRGLVA